MTRVLLFVVATYEALHLSRLIWNAWLAYRTCSWSSQSVSQSGIRVKSGTMLLFIFQDFRICREQGAHSILSTLYERVLSYSIILQGGCPHSVFSCRRVSSCAQTSSYILYLSARQSYISYVCEMDPHLLRSAKRICILYVPRGGSLRDSNSVVGISIYPQDSWGTAFLVKHWSILTFCLNLLARGSHSRCFAVIRLSIAPLGILDQLASWQWAYLYSTS